MCQGSVRVALVRLLHRRPVGVEFVVVATLPPDEGIDSTLHDLLDIRPNGGILQWATVVHPRLARSTSSEPNPGSDILEHDYSFSICVHRDICVVSNDDELTAPPARSELPDHQLRYPLGVQIVLGCPGFRGVAFLELSGCCRCVVSSFELDR